MFSVEGFLRWVYLGRLTLAAGIFGAALAVWTQPEVAPELTLVATLLLVMSLGFTAGSFWHTHIVGQRPGRSFLYAQVLFDVVLVTAVVHMTGRGDSAFVPLYVLVITEGALLLPVGGGILTGALATLLYFVDAVWGGALSGLAGGVATGSELEPVVLVRMGLFLVIAVATAWLAGRVRRAGTELGAVESELRQLRLDTSDILGTLDTGVVTLDSDGTVVYVNPAAESLLGVSSAEWVGRAGLEELDRAVPGAADVVRRTLRTGRPVRRYETHTKGESEVRVLGVRSTALERDEEPWVTLVLQDITDAKRVEDLNRRAERLEAVAELAASLAHEIKNPLASIRSAVEQLTRGRTELPKKDQAVLGDLVLGESDRLSRLLTGFIEFSRVELHERGSVDLQAVARAAVEVVRQHPDAAGGVEIRVDGEPATVQGDEDLLHRVVFNLVLNAVQHSPAGGQVSVEVGPVPDGAVPGSGLGPGVRLRVSDEGPGVPPELAGRIFDPFFTDRPGGSGLGLALVQRAVAAHEGLLFIEGDEGRGATFSVYFPSRLKAMAS